MQKKNIGKHATLDGRLGSPVLSQGIWLYISLD
jgi:hypothetical protein